MDHNIISEIEDFFNRHSEEIKSMNRDDGHTIQEKVTIMLEHMLRIPHQEAARVLDEIEQGISIYQHQRENYLKGDVSDLMERLADMTRMMEHEQRHHIYASLITWAKAITNEEDKEVDVDDVYEQNWGMDDEDLIKEMTEILSNWTPSKENITMIADFLQTFHNKTGIDNLNYIFASWVYVAQRKGDIVTNDTILSPMILGLMASASNDLMTAVYNSKGSIKMTNMQRLIKGFLFYVIFFILMTISMAVISVPFCLFEGSLLAVVLWNGTLGILTLFSAVFLPITVSNRYEEKIIADKIISYLVETKSFLSQKLRYDENKHKKTDKRYIGSKKINEEDRHKKQKDGLDLA